MKYIKLFEEQSNEDIDPYCEEIWEIPDLNYLIGKTVIIINPKDAWYVRKYDHFFDSVKKYWRFTINHVEQRDDEILISRDRNVQNVLPPTMYKLSCCKIIGDPYGEEDWSDDEYPTYVPPIL